ncbi:MAG: hypothetical protein ACPGLY_24195 [Rubripirellula sp.]
MALFGLFGSKKRSLRDYGLDDLNRERIGLEQEQRKIDKEISDLAEDESQLKSEYAQAGSPAQKKMVARKIQSLRVRGRGIDAKSAHCHKMLQAVNNFVIIKDNMEFYERMGVASEIAKMDLAEIETFVNEATIEGTLQQEKLASMLQQVSEGAEQIMSGVADESLDDLMSELDGETPVAERTENGEVGDLMKELDQVISQGEKLANQAQQSPPAKQREMESE